MADFLDPLPLNIKLTDDTGPLDYCSCNLRFTISGQGRKLKRCTLHSKNLSL